MAHVPVVLGGLRRLEGATVLDCRLPPHLAPGLSCGRGVAALVLALLDGPHALSKGGQRLAERGMVALVAAQLHRVVSAVALQALAGSARPTPWRQQDTTTMALWGASADAPQTPGAPRPAYGQSKEGRDERTQVLLSLGVSGEGGSPFWGRFLKNDGTT